MEYIYHSIERMEDLPTIMRQGLIPASARGTNRPGFSNWGFLFFSRDRSYIGRGNALLAIPLTQESIEKYQITIDPFDNTCYVGNSIPPEELLLADCRIGDSHVIQVEWLMAKEWIRQGIMNLPQGRLNELIPDELGIEFFYEDVCRLFFGDAGVEKLRATGIPMKNLFPDGTAKMPGLTLYEAPTPMRISISESRLRNAIRASLTTESNKHPRLFA